jgi:hypothetical protein
LREGKAVVKIVAIEVPVNDLLQIVPPETPYYLTNLNKEVSKWSSIQQ